MARFEQHKDDKGKIKIRDTKNEKWVGDGNGHQIRLDDQDRADNITEIMEKRVEGEWHE